MCIVTKPTSGVEIPIVVLGKRESSDSRDQEALEVSSKKPCITVSETPVIDENKIEDDIAVPTEELRSEEELARMAEIELSNFIRASSIGDIEKIKSILEQRPEILNQTRMGYSALHYAVFYNQRQVVELLIENEVNIDIQNPQGMTPLAWGVDRGHCDLVGFLLESEADPSLPNHEGITPLHIAVRSKNYTMVETLLSINTETEEWTKVNAQTSLGYTPAYMAAFDGCLDMLQLLYEYGADMNISSHVQVSPLHRAVTKNHCDVASFLLECGADVNKKDENGRTPLHIAAFGGQMEIVQLLLNANAIQSKDYASRSPACLAEIRKHEDIIKLLTRYGTGEC